LKKKRVPTNEQIRAKEVRLVSDSGEHFGVVSLKEALEKAKEKELDLVEITSNVVPPVCKITDYGKYIYEENKKKKEQEKTSKTQVKSIRLGFAISRHDMEVRVKSAEKFLEGGDSVKVILPLRGRQKALEGVAREKLEEFLKMLGEKVELKIEKELGKEPRGLTVTVIKK
jgi:translation initiation factor IF-3